MYQKYSAKINNNMRVLKKKHEYITNFMDTLRMSIEKNIRRYLRERKSEYQNVSDRKGTSGT